MLEIQPVELGDDGEWKVVVKNEGGYASSLGKITLTGEGQCSFSSKLWRILSMAVQLTPMDQYMRSLWLSALTLSVPRNYRGPRFLEDLRALLTEEGLVSFECKVVGYPTPVLQWFKDGQELKPGDVYQLSGTNSLGKAIFKNAVARSDNRTASLFIDHSLMRQRNIISVYNSQVNIRALRKIAWVRQNQRQSLPLRTSSHT